MGDVSCIIPKLPDAPIEWKLFEGHEGGKMSEDLDKLRHPIGRYEPPSRIDEDQVEKWISNIETLPADLRRTVEGLTGTQLDTPYRPGGWTIRQVIHHLPDSHMNSFIRFKWALTEDRPEIKAYFEDRWAELPDYTTDSGLRHLWILLEALHRRWVALLRSLTRQDLDRIVHSPRIRPRKPGGNHRFLCLARAAPPGTHPGDDPSRRVELP